MKISSLSRKGPPAAFALLAFLNMQSFFQTTCAATRFPLTSLRWIFTTLTWTYSLRRKLFQLEETV